MPRNQHGARCSRQNRRGAARTRALAQKPGTDHDFLGKSARTCADLSIQPRSLSRRSRFSRQNTHGPARTLAFRPETYRGPRFYRQSRRGPARTLAFRPETYRGPRFYRQNRRGPCSGLLGITKVTIGTYPNWSSKPSIPCRSRAPIPSLAIVWGEGGVRIK